MSPPASDILQNRFLSFLIWQSIQSSAIFILFKAFFFSPFSFKHLLPSLFGTFSFFFFLLSMLLFSISVQILSTPQYRRPASVPELALGIIRLLFSGSASLDSDFVGRVRSSLCIALFVIVSAASSFVAVISIAGSSYSGSLGGLINDLGFKALATGMIYGVYFVFSRRWVLVFPIVQRPPFFSYKMGLLPAVRQASKLSVASFLFTPLFVFLLPNQHKSPVAGKFFSGNFIFFIGSFAVFLFWELILHLHKVLHTKRYVFAPPKGSLAVETSPSDFLLATLEESNPRSLLKYLGYLDLSMVCGSNVEPWRRAAFFEETGETYKRVVAACLRPLEQFASKLAEGLTCSADHTNKLSHQLSSPNDIFRSSEILESFSDFQLYAWCAQAVASLEVRSHTEDRFGVAQLSGSHASVLSTLLSCLLAVETSMGKKINLQSPNHILGPAGIKWATNSTARREITSAINKKRGSPSHSKSYALADVLKTSIYSIVSEFHEEMLASAKMGLLEKEWLNNGKPVYGSTELLVLKLHFFLNFQAS
ncbi:uncharacterized protein LOC130824042 [Amaranthus tricolor]|uniref:uncharacterized protein LOC130824042 n=1 Tax=Amaranthus tricolor TaxID=29722 RepID=UPI002588D944|nr:uncharacterized protein LOC130824042 [Amaranthus tricolor]